MYIKTVDAIRKHMLYRPMVPGGRDILFSGSVQTSGDPKVKPELTAEVEHLTCFIGGMIGLGAQIFGIEGDLEIAKKLADGCVWAYESTVTGIMPEGAEVIACVSAERCAWNETLWYERLDPMADQRDKELEEYFKQKATREAEEAKEKLKALKNPPRPAVTGVGRSNTDSSAEFEPQNIEKTSLRKRQLGDIPNKEVPKPITHDFRDDLPSKGGSGTAKAGTTAADKALEENFAKTEEELNSITTSGRQVEVPLTQDASEYFEGVGGSELPDPFKPLSHKEYVEARLEQEALPPGFVNLRSKKYILRYALLLSHIITSC